MASSYSFDVVSEFDRQELVNALDQVSRELKSRYDLKNSDSKVELSEQTLVIETDSKMTLTAIQDIIRTKASKRNLSQKIFDFTQPADSASGGRVRQTVSLKQGIEKDLAKQISKTIKDSFKKVQPSIQGDTVRVTAKDKDILQEVIQALRQEDYPVPLQFTNYR
ncbi:MAG: YajQ family cyclic di-GMP-binding protein [Cyanobacteria bacterium P01_F01_bin.33]